MMIVKPPADAYAGPPDPEQHAAMGRYNDELRHEGVLLEVDGLMSTAHGAKVKFKADKRTVTDGPFSEAKEVIGGYWIIEVRSKAEALAWAQKIPFSTEVHPGEEVEVEVRQIAEHDDHKGSSR
ncbi:MAG: YciI family protein [Kofleriaceae bacterium]